MINPLISGLLGGIFGPLLGVFVSRFSYSTVAAFGFIAGLIVNFTIAISFIFKYGMDLFLSRMAFASGEWHSILSAFLFMPTIFVIGLFLIRHNYPPPTLEAAQKLLEDSGYEKSISEDGTRVTYKKDNISVLFRIDRRYGPPTAEWWKDGKCKGEYLLSRPPTV